MSTFCCIDEYMSTLQVHILFKNLKNLIVIINFIYGEKVDDKGKINLILMYAIML